MILILIREKERGKLVRNRKLSSSGLCLNGAEQQLGLQVLLAFNEAHNHKEAAAAQSMCVTCCR